MFIRIAPLLIVLALAACTPLSIYHRTGVPVQQMEDELLACRVDALDKAPVASQLRRGAPRYVPGYRHCSSSGRCYHRGGYYLPGEVYTVDVNARLRKDVEAQCMARKGYRPVTLPNCPAGTSVQQSQATNLSGPALLPPLAKNSCGLRGQDGKWQIITPNG